MNNFIKVLFIALTLLTNINNSEAKDMNENQGLTQKQQSIAEIAAFTAIGNIDSLKPALNKALDEGITINEAKEVLVQMYAYAGFPRSLNGIGALMDVLKERQAKGIKDTQGEEGKVLASDVNKWEYGNNVQIELTGKEVKGGMMDFAPAANQFLKEHLFADIFARGILTYQDREVATIAALSALDNVDSQLNSHISIGKNTGLTDEQINEIQTIVQNKVKNIDTIFAKGEPNPYGEFFTGQTYLTMLSDKNEMWNSPIGNVTFEPKARTNWHSHSGGQILLVTNGIGYYQEEGKPARKLQKGDVVRIPIDTKHWHGAAPDSWFVHISVETNGAINKPTWLEPVTDEQYNSATKE